MIRRSRLPFDARLARRLRPCPRSASLHPEAHRQPQRPGRGPPRPRTRDDGRSELTRRKGAVRTRILGHSPTAVHHCSPGRPERQRDPRVRRERSRTPHPSPLNSAVGAALSPIGDEASSGDVRTPGRRGRRGRVNASRTGPEPLLRTEDGRRMPPTRDRPVGHAQREAGTDTDAAAPGWLVPSRLSGPRRDLSCHIIRSDAFGFARSGLGCAPSGLTGSCFRAAQLSSKGWWARILDPLSDGACWRFRDPPPGCANVVLVPGCGLQPQGLLPQERRDLVLENLALRHQLAVFQRSQRRAGIGRP